jgi:type VI secretion system secreted protein VgrG
MADRTILATTIAIDGVAYRLITCHLVESLSDVPSAVVELMAERDAVTPLTTEVIAKPAEITFKRDDGKGERSFCGVVVEAERFRPRDQANHRLRLRIAPKLWRLGKRADCRIFHEKSVPDIVKAVLDKGGVTDHKFDLSGSYSPRKYTAQYRETDLDFILRLLSEEGIYFTVDHEGGKDTVVFGDKPTGFGDITGDKAIQFVHAVGFAPPPDRVFAIRERNVVRSDKVVMRDYDFEKPKLKVEGQYEGKDDGAHALEVYVYPARVKDVAGAKKVAQTLVESMQVERRVVTGQASTIALRPGYKFELESHPYAPLNQEYLVTGVEVEVVAERFEGASNRSVVSFTAVPTAKNAYRPTRREAQRTCMGMQTAWTTGPSGSEIDVDKFMRVHAQFHWDREGKNDDKSSDWMRTQQPHQGGAMYIPRVGWEVSIQYLEGDVDRPLVMQRWYNAKTMPPYKLPDHKARFSIQTATSPGGGSSNEIRFDDTKGKEEMFMNGSKDCSIDVGNNATQSIGANETRTVGSNHKLNVTNSVTFNVKGNQTVTVGANQTIGVQTFMIDDVTGNHTKKVGGMRHMKIGGDHKKTVEGDSKLDVGGMQIDLVVGGISESTPAAMTHKVGAAHVDFCIGDRSVMVGAMRKESVGAVKIVVTKGGRGVEVKGMLMQKVGGAILNKIDGDRSDKAKAMFTEIAAGASILKVGGDVTYEGEALVTLVMGASIMMITPASVMIMGTSAKMDGPVTDTAPMILDN